MQYEDEGQETEGELSFWLFDVTAAGEVHSHDVVSLGMFVFSHVYAAAGGLSVSTCIW